VDGTFERLVLARPLADGDADLRRVVVRPVQLRGMRRLQFAHTHATRDVAKNLDVDEAIEAVDALIGAAFAHAHLQTSLEAIELRVSRKGSIGLSRHKVPSAPAIGGLAADSGSGDAAAHDRAKRRFVSPLNLDRFARVLKPGAKFRFASDIDTYVNWTLLHCRAHGAFAWQAQEAADWHRPYDGWPGTRYEAKAIREGRRPAYLTFIRK